MIFLYGQSTLADMSKALAVVVMGLLAAACGGGDEKSGPCGGRAGASYRVSFHERSGNCGPIPEQVTNPTPAGAPPADPNCDNRTSVSADACTVTVDVTCTVANGQRVTMRGPINWTEDGSSGGGIQQGTIVDAAGNGVCSSTYDVSYTRL